MTTITYWLKAMIVLILAASIISCDKQSTRDQRILVFTKTSGYRHASIETGVEAVRQLGKENGFSIIHTEDAEQFNDENLKTMSVIMFLSTTQDILNPAQEAAMERFIQAGGGFVGVHAAADTEYDWKWYGDLVGGYFLSHPSDPNVRDADINLIDGNHISTNMLPETWPRTDEWYDYKQVREDINVLLKLDESTYGGGKMGDDHPIAWYHEVDGGRAWYTGLGHTEETFSEPLFLQHLLGGIKYAIGDNKLDYAQTRSLPYPDQSRFVKSVLASNLDEPMELDMLPDGRILFIERKGMIKIYDPELDYLSIVTKLPVFNGFEDGLLGMAVDPNFEENNWLYLFYSDPDPDNWEQHLSRFEFKNNQLDQSSEKILLRVPVQRETCCHSGGSVEFGPDGLLYVSTGDDTNPFASDGYAPIDERPGRASWDAQRTSGNANDLRGKILRIKPEPDGTYSIPEGNLFPEGTPKSRPEIYTMGLRNPFRISIDSRRNWLFWGDVGPDAGKDSLNRGPKGYDGFNQAQKAGNWGWPYTRGNNHQYHDYNFVTKESGPKFDPAKPVNNSPNNTGLEELPPATPYFIWYSYDESEEFPWVKTGGKNPMAGPVYYVEDYPEASRFPDYFDGKLIIYEWMRHWFFVVTMDEEGKFVKADPFMPDLEFSRPMDVIIGKDGRMYLLEYGNLWFNRNLDARLTRIDYIRGNRGPSAVMTADRWIGGSPLTLDISAAASSDVDGDKLKYEWWVNDNKLEETSAILNYTFTYPGTHKVKLKVQDNNGAFDVTTAEVQAGNDPPLIAWNIQGNRSFFWDNRSIPYSVSITDREDGSSDDADFDPATVTVSFDYLEQGVDKTEIAQGHLAGLAASQMARGAKLIDASDCKNCHAKDKKVNGPSYLDIATRYRDENNAENYLASKVITGGNGVWGETVMSAHPQISEDQAREMVRYILALGEEKSKQQESYGLEGVLVANKHFGKNNSGTYVLMASYTDLGNGSISPITTREEILLRSPRVPAETADERSENLEVMEFDGFRFLFGFNESEYFVFNDIDLTSIKAIRLGLVSRSPIGGGGFEIRRGSPDGGLLGSGEIASGSIGEIMVDIPISLQEDNIHDLYFVFKRGAEAPGDFALISIDFVPEGQELVTSR